MCALEHSHCITRERSETRGRPRAGEPPVGCRIACLVFAGVVGESTGQKTAGCSAGRSFFCVPVVHTHLVLFIERKRRTYVSF